MGKNKWGSKEVERNYKILWRRSKDINNNRLDAEIICLIVNEPNCGAIDKARKYSIPYIIHNHRDYEELSFLSTFHLAGGAILNIYETWQLRL